MPGGNLSGMKVSDAERRLIAAGWSSTSCDQATYAAKHGISARTLRSWVERYGVGDRPEAKARAIVLRAIDELQDLLAALDAEEARRNGGGEGESDGGMPERQGEPEPKVTSVASNSAVAPRPMPPAGFFAGF